jgi:hypothetical protein
VVLVKLKNYRSNKEKITNNSLNIIFVVVIQNDETDGKFARVLHLLFRDRHCKGKIWEGIKLIEYYNNNNIIYLSNIIIKVIKPTKKNND